MSKNIKAMLAEKLAANTQRHASAQQETVVDYGRTHIMIPVETIDPNPYQPRRIFPQDEIEALAHSIAEAGLLQPITVRPMGERYQIIAGERRWRAHKLLGKNSIEALVGQTEDSDMAIYALAENIDRQDLSDYEIGKALRQVEDLFPTKKRLAEALGLARQDMYRFFAFEELPPAIRTRLDANPRLLARSAAEGIKRILGEIRQKGVHTEAVIDECLMRCWQLLEDGELDQTKFPVHLGKILAAREQEGIISDRQVTDISQAGKRVGSIVRDTRQLVVKLQAGVLTDEQETELQQFVQALVSGKVSQVVTH